MQIPNPDLDFLNSDSKIYFWAFGPKKSKLFSLDENWHTERLDDVNLMFSVSNPKSFFGQIWAEKIKVVHFDWKLAHMVYWGCWILFRQWIFELLTLDSLLGKFGLKESKLFVLPENWHIHMHTQYLKDVDSYFDISFLKF